MTDEKKTILLRAALIYIITGIIGLAIVYEVFYIQYAENKQWEEKGAKITYEWEKVEAIRGNITADDGSLLMTSVPMFDVYMDVNCPNISDNHFKNNASALASNLAALFKDKSHWRYLRDLKEARRKNNRYFLLQRDITYSQLKEMKSFPILKRGRYRGGFIVEPNTERIKPYNELASRTIGFINKESPDSKYVGIEGAYNEYLTGKGGKRLMQKVANGEKIPVHYKKQVAPQNGKDVMTTLDVHIQDVAESSLREQLKKHGADHGCAVVMEVETGYIKAIANLGKTGDNSYGEIYNFAVGEASEPGSTFKTMSFLAALEDGKLPPLSDSIETGNGEKRYADRTMTDAHRGGFGTLSVKEVFEKSSNVGVSTIITEAYQEPEKFIEQLHDFSLHQKVGIGIRGEAQPFINHPDNRQWSAVSLPWTSIGYEVKLTPLQILTFYNAIANDGRMMQPRLVKEIRQSGKPTKVFRPEVLQKSIASKDNLDIMRTLLEKVVEKGTAQNLKNTLYKIAGKTGTAQIANQNTGYNKTDYKASFVGYFPAVNPKYSIIVVINKPTKGSYYGNQVSGTVFKDIADKLYATHLDAGTERVLPQDNTHPPILVTGKRDDLQKIYNDMGYKVRNNDINSDWVISMRHKDTLRFDVRRFRPGVVPNVVGMSAKDAVYILEKLGLNTRVYGKGHVSRQSLTPGTKIRKGRKIDIYLSS
ncbi:MAG: transpeptidase family protein [Bacteroidales bacterium]|nr:transpeptidase family protein [Bacteroidales bacterium]MCF8333288.1 transpeptidase family protein [Bacteroidales bacterium]